MSELKTVKNYERMHGNCSIYSLFSSFSHSFEWPRTFSAELIEVILGNYEREIRHNGSGSLLDCKELY
jgi:hypothetical protein